jgi:hypothetical protein
MVGDLVAHVSKLRGVRIEQLPTPEPLRIDPVGHVLERPGFAMELLCKTVRIRLRSCDVVALDRDDELVEARKVVRDLIVTLDVRPVLREEIASRGDEAEVAERVG